MANNRIILKRTNTAGRTPNTTGSYVTNSQYISAGELALNMADGILYSSNGSAVIEIGANNVNQRITNSLTIDSNKALRFQTVNTSAVAYFIQQNDDNFVFYTTNTSYGARPVYSIFANSNSSELSFATPVRFNGNVTALTANGSLGSAGQVLTSNGTNVYWATAAGGGSVNTAAQYTWTNTQTFSANVTFGAAIIANSTTGSAGQVLTSNGSAVYWSTVSAPSSVFPIANVISNTAFTAVKDNRYFLTNASSTTVTLPASPSVGDTVYIVVVNNLANNTVARNGSNIMSLAENLILDINYFSIGLTYVTANTGWVIV